ncbi:MAG: hypothetical protein IKI37_07620 [Oscillospiraceae bacterium]|nr:hypothetical protein [Oscillospiraceae bacterium]
MSEGEFITTPQLHIKLGQLCRNDKGEPVLSVKRGKKDEYENVPISYLMDTLHKVQESMTDNHMIL